MRTDKRPKFEYQDRKEKEIVNKGEINYIRKKNPKHPILCRYVNLTCYYKLNTNDETSGK